MVVLVDTREQDTARLRVRLKDMKCEQCGYEGKADSEDGRCPQCSALGGIMPKETPVEHKDDIYDADNKQSRLYDDIERGKNEVASYY